MSRKTLAERLAAGAETAEQRRQRLVEQAGRMRAAQALRRAEGHKCPPSKTDAQLARLQDLLQRVAPDNIAPQPIGMMLEGDTWFVDVTVRIRGVTDYEVAGDGKTLADALAKARGNLANQEFNLNRAARDAARYGYAL
jgi:hypothetical protein